MNSVDCQASSLVFLNNSQNEYRLILQSTLTIKTQLASIPTSFSHDSAIIPYFTGLFTGKCNLVLMYDLESAGLRCISIKPDDFSQCIRSLRIRNTIKTENEMSLNEDILIHHKLLHRNQHENAVGKCYENEKATQFNSNSCGAQDKSDNIGRFCSVRHGNMTSMPFEIAIGEFKKKKYI